MGHTLTYLLSLALLSAAIAFLIIGLVNDDRNWWYVDEIACADSPWPLPGKILYGPLGLVLPSGDSDPYSHEFACFPLKNNLNPNASKPGYRFIGIAAVVCLALALIFGVIAASQCVGALFGISHARRHARKASHSAIIAAIFSLFAAILVLGWFVGAADGYSETTRPAIKVQYAQVLCFCAVPAFLIAAVFMHRHNEHHGYSPF